jgi:hypothetical protein
MDDKIPASPLPDSDDRGRFVLATTRIAAIISMT